MKKWLHWSRLKWNDRSKIVFEKIYTKVKNIVERKLKKNIFNKNEFFSFCIQEKEQKQKRKNRKSVWKFEKVNTL